MNKCLNCGKKVKNKYCNVSCQNSHQCKGRKKSLKSIEKRIETNKNKWKLFKVECHKCQKEFEIKEYDMEHPKKEKYFCSRSCANSRVKSDEIKKKISQSISKKISLGERVGFCKLKTEDEKLLSARKRYKRNYKSSTDKVFTCKVCNVEFCNIKGRSCYCSDECKSKLWSSIQKKAYAEGSNYVAGGTVEWIEYKNIKVQGSYEIRCCIILDKLKEQGKIVDWEYTDDKYPYVGTDNKNHTYLLDFKITGSTDNIYYIETKGRVKSEDELKWSAVRDCGKELKVWFLKDIKEKEKEVGLGKEWKEYIKK